MPRLLYFSSTPLLLLLLLSSPALSYVDVGCMTAGECVDSEVAREFPSPSFEACRKSCADEYQDYDWAWCHSFTYHADLGVRREREREREKLSQPPTVACKNGSSVRICMRCMHVLARFASILYAQTVLIDKISASELRRKFIKSALLVGCASYLATFPPLSTQVCFHFHECESLSTDCEDCFSGNAWCYPENENSGVNCFHQGLRSD